MKIFVVSISVMLYTHGISLFEWTCWYDFFCSKLLWDSAIFWQTRFACIMQICQNPAYMIIQKEENQLVDLYDSHHMKKMYHRHIQDCAVMFSDQLLCCLMLRKYQAFTCCTRVANILLVCVTEQASTCLVWVPCRISLTWLTWFAYIVLHNFQNCKFSKETISNICSVSFSVIKLFIIWRHVWEWNNAMQ